ncbi:MAG: hypothetical protein LUI09_03395 [Prevotellaceae bacterium]|nr:hypothetical protein [Prevotellaceae bacterium]
MMRIEDLVGRTVRQYAHERGRYLLDFSFRVADASLASERYLGCDGLRLTGEDTGGDTSGIAKAYVSHECVKDFLSRGSCERRLETPDTTVLITTELLDDINEQ